MPGPLTKIDHKTRDVAQALTSNCWYVFHRPAPTEATPQPHPQRIVGARKKGGQFQVRVLKTWKWQDVAAQDSLYQQ